MRLGCDWLCWLAQELSANSTNLCFEIKSPIVWPNFLFTVEKWKFWKAIIKNSNRIQFSWTIFKDTLGGTHQSTSSCKKRHWQTARLYLRTITSFAQRRVFNNLKSWWRCAKFWQCGRKAEKEKETERDRGAQSNNLSLGYRFCVEYKKFDKLILITLTARYKLLSCK